MCPHNKSPAARMTTDITVHSDADTLARTAAELVTDYLFSEAGRLAVALSGGSTPKRLYELLASPEYAERIPWPRVHWFWSDERFVPPDDPRSNFHMFKTTVLSHVPVPTTNIHPIPTVGLTPKEAANAYATELRKFHGDSVLRDDAPLFDVVLLGLGDDGHTASLFPGAIALEERSTWVAAVRSPQSEPRITLTYPALESCRHCLFLVAGPAKKGALTAVLRGEDVPATRLEPRGQCAWLVDQSAAPNGPKFIPPQL